MTQSAATSKDLRRTAPLQSTATVLSVLFDILAGWLDTRPSRDPSPAPGRHHEDGGRTPHGARAGYLVPELKRWKLACPVTPHGLVFSGELNAQGERGPIDADKLLRNILRRVLRRAGLPPLRFHDMRHLAGTLSARQVCRRSARREILGHADVRTTLAIYTHATKRRRDDSADRMAQIAGLASVGDKWETNDDVEKEESMLSDCSDGSPGWNRAD